MINEWKKDILTIPNLLSLFRLTLIPVYIRIYLNASLPVHYYLAGTILAISCLTDLLDGQIARRFHMVTTVGKILDPFADKATQFTLMVCLSIRYKVLWVITALFVVKESFQLIAGLLTLRKGKILTGALFSGKLCTGILFSSMILMILCPALNNDTVMVLSAIDCIFMLIAFGDYIRTYFQGITMFQDINANGS